MKPLQAQPYRKGMDAPHGPAGAAMRAGRTADGQNPMDLKRTLAKNRPGGKAPVGRSMRNTALAQALAQRKARDRD